MTDLQRLQLRQSEIRSQLAKIAAADATDETRAQVDELGTEYGHNESNLRALTIAGDEPVETKSGDREMAALVSGANLGELLSRYDKVLVPEMNTGQLLPVLRSAYLVPAEGLNKVSGQPFKIGEIEDAILERVEN